MSFIAVLLLLNQPCAAPLVVQEWGDVKGQVVFDGDKIPENKKANVTNDRAFCLSKGPILQDKLVIDPKTKGVRWVIAWLAPVKNFRKAKAGDVPIHPSLRQVPKEATIRARCCKFEPRVLTIREGTELVIDQGNDGVAHFATVDGEGVPWYGSGVPQGKRPLRLGGIKAAPVPAVVRCAVHPWMKGWLFTSPHPYVAVTDEQGHFALKHAPVGRWRLVLWQEESGYHPFRNKDDVGLIVEIKAGKTTDLGKIRFEEPKD